MYLSRNNQNTGKFMKINDPILYVKMSKLVLNFSLGYYFAYSTKAHVFYTQLLALNWNSTFEWITILHTQLRLNF